MVVQVGALSQTSDPGRYWPELKSNIIKESEGSQLLGEIEKLKMLAADGKMRETDCANLETISEVCT
jgi:hypothetical protein